MLSVNSLKNFKPYNNIHLVCNSCFKRFRNQLIFNCPFVGLLLIKI